MLSRHKQQKVPWSYAPYALFADTNKHTVTREHSQETLLALANFSDWQIRQQTHTHKQNLKRKTSFFLAYLLTLSWTIYWLLNKVPWLDWNDI